MTRLRKNALVIGAAGFLGRSIASMLSMSGWRVRAIDKNSIIETGLDGVECLCGNIFDEQFLIRSLNNIDVVYFFLSSLLPSANSENQSNKMLNALSHVLDKMKECGVEKIVFPSSGGAIYGNVISGSAKEEDMLAPVTIYGAERMECEKYLARYASLGISSMILRISNVYGSLSYREVKQGVIDIFIQKAIMNEEVSVWGNALTNIRDYIFVDDFTDAVEMISDREFQGFNVYNIGSGVGVSLKEIIGIINDKMGKPLKVNHAPNDVTDSIERIVLNCNKVTRDFGWRPKYNIEQGIIETINRKKRIMEKHI